MPPPFSVTKNCVFVGNAGKIHILIHVDERETIGGHSMCWSLHSLSIITTELCTESYMYALYSLSLLQVARPSHDTREANLIDSSERERHNLEWRVTLPYVIWSCLDMTPNLDWPGHLTLTWLRMSTSSLVFAHLHRVQRGRSQGCVLSLTNLWIMSLWVTSLYQQSDFDRLLLHPSD